ncbi:MAG: hypothetical protein HOG19_15225 [Gammaproteobacteria bacterium]|nr:hypothetical protein [Gammaproteobacteria bacterium]
MKNTSQESTSTDLLPPASSRRRVLVGAPPQDPLDHGAGLDGVLTGLRGAADDVALDGVPLPQLHLVHRAPHVGAPRDDAVVGGEDPEGQELHRQLHPARQGVIEPRTNPTSCQHSARK